MVVHFDNATSHTAKCTIDHLKADRLTQAPRPAFSLDLVLSDFNLFGKLKMALVGTAFSDDEPLGGVMEALNEISREELEPVFEE
jgi:hypothetical protein